VLFENSKSVYAPTQVSFRPVGFSRSSGDCATRARLSPIASTVLRSVEIIGSARFSIFETPFCTLPGSLAMLPATAYVRGLGSCRVISSANEVRCPCVYLFRKLGSGA
jgi:hypothetical protein